MDSVSASFGPRSLLIPAAKQPGRRAQKRHEGSAYEFGAAQRLSQSFLIDVIYSHIWDGEAPEEGLGNSQKFCHAARSKVSRKAPVEPYMGSTPGITLVRNRSMMSNGQQKQIWM